MAAFDFPNSPSVNDQYTANGVTFKWNGTIWQRISASSGAQGTTGSSGPTGAQGAAAGLTISTSAPGSPSAGDMWWDSDSGLFLTYYNDGNSSQWVELNQGPKGAQGATGPTGAQGATGSTGAQGAAGAQGATGAAGSNASISSNADNRIITGGSGTNLVGESGLTYNGTRLDVTTGDLQVIGGEGGDAEIRIVADQGDDGADYWRFQSAASGNNLNIATYASGAWVDKVSINSNGRVNIGDTNNTNNDLDYCRLSIYGQTSQNGTNKNLNLLNVYNYGSGNSGDITGIGLGAAASPDYTKASLAFIRTTSYGRGDLIFCINSEGNANMVTESDERLRIDSNGKVIVKTNGLNLENATATNSRHFSITNAAGTTGWAFGNGVTASAHQFVIYDNTAGAARLQINGSGAFGLAGANYGTSGQVLTSQGSGSAPAWKGGGGLQVLEQFSSPADGSSFTTSKGTVTVQNPADWQALNTSLNDAQGSVITYQPPDGTVQVIYEFQYHIASDTDSNAILGARLLWDGQEITHSRFGQRGGTNYFDQLNTFKWVFNIGGSTDYSVGRLASWTSGKVIKLQMSEYNSSYEFAINLLRNYGSSGAINVFRRPIISITAIGTPS